MFRHARAPKDWGLPPISLSKAYVDPAEGSFTCQVNCRENRGIEPRPPGHTIEVDGHYKPLWSCKIYFLISSSDKLPMKSWSIFERFILNFQDFHQSSFEKICLKVGRKNHTSKILLFLLYYHVDFYESKIEWETYLIPKWQIKTLN